MVAGATDTGSTDMPVFGPYRILELLGQGGMGVVHRAYDTVHDRVVALKRLPSSITDREYRVRFRREARIAAGLKHPNVIPVNDFGEIDGDLYLDMKLIEGTDLRRGLGSGTFEVDRTIRILSQVALALDAAHERGLIHRDVKPSNILIGDDGQTYLADFGIARETSPEATALTRSGDLIGTWDYMAPERMSAGAVDGRSDQYSLACVLFECLTGRLAHPASDPAAKVAAHLLQPPPAPSVFVPTISRELDAVVMRGMAKEPARRFATTTAMMKAAGEAAYAGVTTRAAQSTEDQGKIVRAILRSSSPRKGSTLPILHNYPPTCPYPGLIGFEQSDADLFHGRDHVVTELLVRLAEQLDGGEPVVLVGASGAGKSSVLHAGLLPKLADDPAWPQVVITPGSDPIGFLAAAIAPHTGMAAADIAQSIRQRPTKFGEICARAGRSIIVVDQFEELFTHGVPEADRRAFATALAHARPALALLAVRADLVDRCIELNPLMPALTAPVLLGSMDATELRQAIVQPARDFGVEIEPGLPERLIADLGVRGEVRYDPGALPRMAHALREAWNYREGSVLTLAAYRRAGGIDGAVSRTAEDIFARLDHADREALRGILLRLVAVSDDGTVARRRVDPQEISGYILDNLIAARLVTVDATGARLSHEALLTAWPRLRDWIDEDRAGLVQHRRFIDAVRVWVESGQHSDDLYRGVRLATVNSWLDRGRTQLQPAEQEFLVRSNAAEYAGQITARRRTRRLRTLVAALSVLLLVAAGAVVVATELRQDAQDERNRADIGKQMNLSRQLAAEASLARGTDPRRAALSALGSWQAGETAEGRSALLGTQTDHYKGRMQGHQGAVSSVAISGDGKIAASGGRDGSLRLWDVPNRRELTVLADGDGWFRTVSMTADGRFLLAANPIEGKVTLWSVPDRKILFTVPDKGIDGQISFDGKTFVAWTDRGVAVWDVESHVERARFPAANSLAMAYSPDGSLVATTNKNNVDIHRVSDGAVVASLAGHTDDVLAMAFDRTGTQLASTSMDGSLRLWDTSKWTQIDVMTTVGGGLATVAFSPTGTGIMAAGIGTTVYVWDRASRRQLLGLATGSVTTFGLTVSGDGHTFLSADSAGVITVWAFQRSMLGTGDEALVSVAFQPKGKLLATAGGHGTVRLWDVTTGDMVKQLQGAAGKSYHTEFSPDGAKIVAVGDDGLVIVWNTVTGAEEARFSRPGTEFTQAAYSPDGKTIAVAGKTPADARDNVDRDEVMFLQATDLSVANRRPTREEPRNAEANKVDVNYPTALSYSPDGRSLAVTLSAGKVGLLNLADPGSEMTILAGHEGIATDAEFSPDSQTLATAGSDRLVRLWHTRDGSPAGVITGHDATVRRVTFSPDGKTLATASQDRIMRLWDVASHQSTGRFERHEDDLNDVAFDWSGKYISSASADGTVRTYILDTKEAVRQVCAVLDRDTLADEWKALGPDRGDQPVCPS
ncbi:WD40 repeat protein/serine/threonine protein kinase [Kibdelosporangium banguiense]|uniref:WD40 repeat protein/serine/threonine protein kinase n=1 Tax=Kibdelosporangium banguiense TaxID=1365924 RepID=A0ABS4TTI4_9PSEU|nr:protein kinase [Kibdelosporangium banguiense]MBP2327712.1 WD40 repeat protein/serine/threonine protein kinase [Kibdelosporangium banguiense]